jgi:hypothetical protein
VSVYLTIPSARPPEEAEKVLKLWRERGYKIALWCDPPESAHVARLNDRTQVFVHHPYPGYSAAVNNLIKGVMNTDPTAEWFIIGGDDVEPDPNHSAEDIAAQTCAHFGGAVGGIIGNIERNPFYRTFGVMQPTGDRFAQGSIDKIAGSAWIGRSFCKRAYSGQGPLWPEYHRFFQDQELQEVAIKLGVFQQRPDLVHFHHWYGRATSDLYSETKPAELPPHLKEQEKLWQSEKALFYRRQRAGFPGSEPIA